MRYEVVAGAAVCFAIGASASCSMLFNSLPDGAMRFAVGVVALIGGPIVFLQSVFAMAFMWRRAIWRTAPLW